MDEYDKVLSKIKGFEESLKRMLLETYGKFLPEDKVSLLNATNYTTFNLLGLNSSDEVRGELLRKMLDDILEMNTVKEISLEDGSTITLNYGQCLEDTLINYYAKKISEKYNFNIDEIDGLSEDLETVKKLYEKLGDSLDSDVFNKDAVELLKKADIKELVDKYDKEELAIYFNNVKKVAGIDEMTKQEQNDVLKESSNRIDSVQIVWLHDKKHLKYIDPYAEVHLTDISNAPRVEEFYKQKLANLEPGEKLDPEEFHRELQTYYAQEMELLSTNDVKKDELNSKQVDMLQFINTNPELRNLRNRDIVKHNSQMDIHVMKATKDIVTTENKDGFVNADIIKDGNAEITGSMSQTNNDISNQLISKDEYIRLRNKLLSGEEMSDEELEALRRAATIYEEEVKKDLETNEQKKDEGGISLKPKDPYNSGFTIKSFALYFIVLSILFLTIIAIVLLR